MICIFLKTLKKEKIIYMHWLILYWASKQNWNYEMVKQNLSTIAFFNYDSHIHHFHLEVFRHPPRALHSRLNQSSLLSAIFTIYFHLYSKAFSKPKIRILFQIRVFNYYLHHFFNQFEIHLKIDMSAHKQKNEHLFYHFIFQS